jgi:hypothetical protein
MKNIILVLILCLGPMMMAAGQEQQAQKLLSEAIYQEEVNGDLDGAIKAYQLIINKYPGVRKVSAEAYFHMGICYEKLGKQDAMKAYQEVIRNYGEQKEIVVKARERLSKLTQNNIKSEEPEGIKIRQIWKEPYTDYLGTVTADGRLRAYVYWGNGDVAVQNIITGENQILTHTADLGDSIGFAEEPLISKNGKQIVYSWWNPYNTSDLFIIDVNNPLPRHLYRQEGEELYPVAWLSDKEIIVTRYNTKTETAQITSFNISDGTFHVLKTFDRRKWPQLSCSPDGKSIAFDFANETDNGNFDINILPVDGSSEISIVRHPANDRVLG